jgi:hypothetical protein
MADFSKCIKGKIQEALCPLEDSLQSHKGGNLGAAWRGIRQNAAKLIRGAGKLGNIGGKRKGGSKDKEDTRATIKALHEALVPIMVEEVGRLHPLPPPPLLRPHPFLSRKSPSHDSESRE